jgi:hypothetical protein
VVNYETRVLALFEEANPVPEMETLSREFEPAAYLASIQTRSSEMTQLDQRTTTGAGGPRPNLGWVVAAVVALVAGVVAIIVSQRAAEAPAVVTEPPAAVTTLPGLTETTVPESSPTTLSTKETAWMGTKVLLGSRPLPGTYRTDEFMPEFKYEITPGWKPAETEKPHILGLTTSSDWDASTDVGPDLAVYFAKPETDSIEGATSIFTSVGDTGEAASASGVKTGEQSPTVIGGAEGVKFEVDTESFRFQLMGRAGADSPGVFFDEDKLYEIHVVDVDGEIVTVVVQAPPEFFDDFKERARTLLDSVVWRDLD